MKCDKCAYDWSNSGDSAHICGPVNIKTPEDYDVVIDTLQKKIDTLWKMTKSNMDNDMMNIMDDIRLEQISQLEKAIAMWQSVSSHGV